MEANLLGHDDEDCGFEVFDERGNRHVISINWDGSLDQHATPDYPNSPEDRTFEEQRIMTQVAERAKLAAQKEFPDADILAPDWNPNEIERAIEALQTMHVDDFAAEFEEFYRSLTDPPSVDGVPEGRAEVIYQPFLVDEDDEIAYVPTPVVQYLDESGTVAVTEQESRYEELVDDPSLRRFTMELPPLSFSEEAYEFPDGFQVFVIEHLGAQIRDLHRHVGEHPPEPYSEIDLPGIALTAAEPEFYENWPGEVPKTAEARPKLEPDPH